MTVYQGGGRLEKDICHDVATTNASHFSRGVVDRGFASRPDVIEGAGLNRNKI